MWAQNMCNYPGRSQVIEMESKAGKKISTL